MLLCDLPRIAIPLFVVVLCGCERLPEVYPPPPQRHPADFQNPAQGSIMVNMNDPDIAEHIVSDVGSGLEGGSWRWTGRRPTLKVLLVKTGGLKFVADFTVSPDTLKQTGPVTISFYIGDKLLDKTRYDTAGYKHIEKPVDSAWLQTASDTIYSAEVDKVFTAPVDGNKLGFILTKMGFERQ